MSLYGIVENNQLIGWYESSIEPQPEDGRLFISAGNITLDQRKYARHENGAIVVGTEITFPDVNDLPQEVSVKCWDSLTFIRKFTQEERIVVRTRRATDMVVDDIMYLLENSTTICANDPDVVNGLNYLVSIGVLTTARAFAILEH